MIDQSLQPTTEAGLYCQAMQRTRQAWWVLVCLRWKRIVTRESILDKERIRFPKTSTILCSYWPSVTPQRKYVIIIRCHNRQESTGIIEWCAVICCAGARFIRRDTRRRFRDLCNKRLTCLSAIRAIWQDQGATTQGYTAVGSAHSRIIQQRPNVARRCISERSLSQ